MIGLREKNPFYTSREIANVLNRSKELLIHNTKKKNPFASTRDVQI